MASFSQDDSVTFGPRPEGWCNFALVKIKVNKGMQVDTLVPQAMKDVPSCEKRRGAAKKR